MDQEEDIDALAQEIEGLIAAMEAVEKPVWSQDEPFSEKRYTDFRIAGMKYDSERFRFFKDIRPKIERFCVLAQEKQGHYRPQYETVCAWAKRIFALFPSGAAEIFILNPIYEPLAGQFHPYFLDQMEEYMNADGVTFQIDSVRFCETIILFQRGLQAPNQNMIERSIELACALFEHFSQRCGVLATSRFLRFCCEDHELLQALVHKVSELVREEEKRDFERGDEDDVDDDEDWEPDDLTPG